MKLLPSLLFTGALALALPVHAQHHHHPAGYSQSPASQGVVPYAALQEREIKALSPQHMEDLRAGRGMSQALAAELNGYPGPSHVLELAGVLDLSPAQQKRVQQLFQAMQAEAGSLGNELIEAERALDQLFVRKVATPEKVDSATSEVGRLQGRLRAAHLNYHVAMVDVLTPSQLAEYKRRRGYR